MQPRHGAYYHVATLEGRQKWTRLAPISDYGEALRRWAEIEGTDKRQGDTVAEAVHSYLGAFAEQVKAGERSAKTLTGYQASSVMLLGVLGDMPLIRVTDQDVRRYRSGRANADGKPAPIAANRELALLSASYGHAAELGWIAAAVNPCRHVKRNQERARTRYVTDAEMTRVLASASPTMRAAITISASTGMRMTDLLKLRLSDLTDDGIAIKASKTGKGMVYEWTDVLRAAVEIAKAAKHGHAVRSLYLFPGREPGRHMTMDGWESNWARLREKAGVPDLQWRDWRRKAGSDTTLAHAVELLDHSDGRTTKRHYRAGINRVKPVR
jgi:integrase